MIVLNGLFSRLISSSDRTSKTCATLASHAKNALEIIKTTQIKAHFILVKLRDLLYFNKYKYHIRYNILLKINDFISYLFKKKDCIPVKRKLRPAAFSAFVGIFSHMYTQMLTVTYFAFSIKL